MGELWSSMHGEELDPSALVLITLVVMGAIAGLLFQIGLVGCALAVIGGLVRRSVRAGFGLWKRLFAWADWLRFLAVVAALLLLGGLGGPVWPWLWVLCGSALLVTGLSACLAYMFIDLERYEVGRGYMALHTPLKGQTVAVNLVSYGHQVGVPLLVAATVALIGGFALFNQGLYYTSGHSWYSLGAEREPRFLDFLAYPLNNLFRVVDLLDLAGSYHFLHATYVRPVSWQASVLLVAFKTFFTLVLLQQVFASLRRGRLLAETITEFWSPHEPIHDRALGSLPQHGVGVIQPLLQSLNSVEFLTKEQREQIPPILAGIGPAAVPVLVQHLTDEHENVRGVAAGALGRLHAIDALEALVGLREDPSAWVRQSLVEALGIIGSPEGQVSHKRRFWRRRLRIKGQSPLWFFWRKRRTASQPAIDPIALIVSTLSFALADTVTAVRGAAAKALGLIGPAATAAAPQLIRLLQDSDETVRCQAAESLGQTGGSLEDSVPALVGLLSDVGPAIRTSAAKALGALKGAAAEAVPALLPLMQDREEPVRQAAAEALGAIGTLNGDHTPALVGGLASPDTIVRAGTAEALGSIGATAAEATAALVEALTDPNDRVRAKAAEALGRIGEAAESAVPGLVRALRDKDSWVSALAAEALGEMGEAADDAVPALIRSLGHLNPQVRGNAAEALGKLGTGAEAAVPALAKAAQDADGTVRSQVVRALGEIDGTSATVAQVLRTALTDGDPSVRTAAIEAVAKPGEVTAEVIAILVQLLGDANDQVQIQATKVLPRLIGATPPVLEGLCALLGDENLWVQVSAALALGQFGPTATSAGAPLLRAAQTGETTLREHAVRALVLIQPPELISALSVGLKDANGDIRRVASAGLMKMGEIPVEMIPALTEALNDPEVQVRANAAHALARLAELPAEAVPALLECTTDPRDGLRINAAMALKNGPTGAVRAAFEQLIEDPNSRVRLVAAGFLLPQDAGHAKALTVVREALTDPTPRLRTAALELVDALGPHGAAWLDVLKQRLETEEETESRAVLQRIVERLEHRGEGGATIDAATPEGAS